MATIPEIALEQLLKSALPKLKTSPDLLDDLFGAYPQSLRDEAKGWIKEHDVDVRLNWSQEAQTSVSVTIICASSNEDEGLDALGNEMGEKEVEDTDINNVTWKGIAERKQYRLYIDSIDPRLTIYLSLAIKAILVLNDTFLLAAGLNAFTIGEGDLTFDDARIPELKYPRVVTVSGVGYFSVPQTERLIRTLVVKVLVNGSDPNGA